MVENLGKSRDLGKVGEEEISFTTVISREQEEIESSASIYKNFFSGTLFNLLPREKGKSHNEGQGAVKIKFYFQTQSQCTKRVI